MDEIARAAQASSPPAWGKVRPLTISGPPRSEGRCAVVETSDGACRITLHEFGVRLRFGADGQDYQLLDGSPEAADLRIETDAEGFVISGAGFSLHLSMDPFKFILRRGRTIIAQSAEDGHFTRAHRLPPFARAADGWFTALDLPADAPVYGLGEKWGALDRRGGLFQSYNQDALGVNAEWSYKNTPFAWSPGAPGGAAFGIFCHTAGPVTHAIGYGPWSNRAYGLYAEGDGLDLFLFAGRDGAEIIGQYTELTGRSAAPPLWSLGAILSKAYYRTADEILAAAREVRARGMPCDVITLDGRAWQDTDTRFAFEWDPKRYPHPEQVLSQLRELGFKVCVWEYPLISTRNSLFEELAAKGWLLRDARTGAAYRYRFDPEPFGQVLTQLPESGLLDFTHPEAYAFWRDAHAPLFAAGVDMIKADFGEQVEDHCLAHDGAKGRMLHNVYALLYNRCVYEAAQRHAPNGAFLFTRSTWASGQRYPSQWGGDPQADWGGLAGSLRGAQSWGMSGGAFYATDIGGFYGDQRDPELYVRWMQAGVFGAHMRLHGIGPREPWSYGPEAEAAAFEALKLRYRLIPYLHNAFETAIATGLPVQRSMALAFPETREAWAFENQWMCGDDLLVAPCVRPGGVVEVYLPPGDWRRFPDGTPFAGGRTHRMTLGLAEMAVFARAGARIPLGPDVQSTNELGGTPQVSRFWTAD